MSYTEHIVKFPNRFLMFRMYNVKGLIEDGKIVETEYYKKEYEKHIKEYEEMTGEVGELTIDRFREWYDCEFGEGEFDDFMLGIKLTGMMREKELIFHPQMAKQGKEYYFKNEILEADEILEVYIQ